MGPVCSLCLHACTLYAKLQSLYLGVHASMHANAEVRGGQWVVFSTYIIGGEGSFCNSNVEETWIGQAISSANAEG